MNWGCEPLRFVRNVVAGLGGNVAPTRPSAALNFRPGSPSTTVLRGRRAGRFWGLELFSIFFTVKPMYVLIEKIRVIDPEAADWLVSQAYGSTLNGYDMDADDVIGAFVWKDTPQGWDFWAKINTRVHHVLLDEIIIDNGEMFQGTPEMFEDCFFSSATPKLRQIDFACPI